MRTTARLVASAAAVAAVTTTGVMAAWSDSAAAVGTQPATASAGPHWASADKATVHPGVKVSMGDVPCLAGFIFTDGKHAFIAVPGGCSGPGEVANPKCD